MAPESPFQIPLSQLDNDELSRIVANAPFFQKIFDAFPVLVVVKSVKGDSFGEILIWNRFAADLTGVSLNEALGKHVDENFPPDQRQFFRDKDRESIDTRQQVIIDEEPIQTRSRGMRWLRTIKTPIFDEQGGPLALLVVSEDITEAREGRRNLLSERTLLQGVLTSAPIGIVAKSLRADGIGKYLIWNEKMERMFNLPASQVIGRTSSEIFDPVLASVFLEQDQQASASDGIIETPPLAAKFGEKSLVIRTFKVRINEADGSPLALIGVIEDVTDHEKTSADLRETEGRWQLALAATDAGVWDWNARSGAVFLSQRFRELARISHDFECDSVEDLQVYILEDGVQTIRDAMQAHLRGDVDVFRAEVRLNTDDDSEVWLVINGKAQVNSGGQADRAIGTIFDVTPVKIAERQMALSKDVAEAANRAKGDFLAMMSHEIRTPLNGVLGFADLLAESKLTDQQREFLQTIRDSGGALLAILNDILDYSKIEAGKLDVEMKPTDVRQIVQSLIAFFHPQAEKKGIELRLQIHSSVPSLVMCDPVRVRQIILNLMGNALKFTSRGFVEFDLCSTPSNRSHCNDICFYVRDSGIGISETDLSRLFEPFNQLDASTARRFGGTGLGLSIVKRLAELMGGAIAVESEVGAGTTFHVTLPCQLVEKDYDPRKTMLIQLDITPDFAKSRPMRILVAEDNLVNRKLARLLLQKFGYTPDEAEDGSRAVAMALERPYDLILMDIQMPGMDGYEAAHRVRELCPVTPHIVALTAHALKSDELRSKEQGMDGHLSKPIRADHLRKMLEKAFRALHARKVA